MEGVAGMLRLCHDEVHGLRMLMANAVALMIFVLSSYFW